MNDIQTRTVDVDRVNVTGNRLTGHAAVFDCLSEPLAEGYRERIAKGAFTQVLDADADVRLLVDHKPPPLARTKAGTLRLREDDTGLAFEADLPDTQYARDLRTSLTRGDLDGMSFSFTIAAESWDGDVRVVERVESLRDICIACFPAYPETSVQLRTRNTPEESMNTSSTTANPTINGSTTTTGGLQVEDRAFRRSSTLTAAFRREGFPAERAAIPWGEFRAVTYPTEEDFAPVRRLGVPLGSDTRYAFGAFAQVPVDAGTTAVQVLRQSSRTLAAAADVIRDIDETSPKPEVDTDTELVTVALNQVAAVETGIPNVVLEQDAIRPLIETDLRLSINEGLDKLILDAVALSDNQDPASDALLVSIRKAITVIQSSGYAADTLILTPADAETLDILQTDGPEAFYVFGAGRFAPGQLVPAALEAFVSEVLELPVTGGLVLAEHADWQSIDLDVPHALTVWRDDAYLLGQPRNSVAVERAHRPEPTRLSGWPTRARSRRAKTRSV